MKVGGCPCPGTDRPRVQECRIEREEYLGKDNGVFRTGVSCDVLGSGIKS